MQKFNLYLFDFDGTLFDTLPSSKYVFKKSYETIGIEIKEEDVLGYTREPIQNSYPRIGAPQEKFAFFIESINKYMNSMESVNLVEIYSDTYDALIDLRSDEAELGIVTNNNVKHVKDILNKFSMQNYFFSVMVGNGEAPLPKPHPSSILKALEMINYQGDKKDVCYVGDSLNDCEAALKAGIVPILLDRDGEYPDVPFIKITSLNDLLK